MNKPNKTASLTIEALWIATENDECFDLDQPGYLHLHAERVGSKLLAISHTFEQNGDLMRDPEIVFYREAPGSFICTECTQDPSGGYTRCAELDGYGLVTGTYQRALRGVTELANILGKNIQTQFPAVAEMVRVLKKSNKG